MKLERPPLHDTVVKSLRKFIIEGKLAAGVKLNERELSETLGISRTPLREALKVLAAEGLIEISLNKGASVLRMSTAEIRDMFELMSGLEAFSGELACERITAAEVAEIESLHYAMLECRSNNDLSGYYDYNQQIHDKINDATRNTALQQAYTSINHRLQALRFRSNFHTPRWDHAIYEHSEMIQALKARDGRWLASILRQHLLFKRDAVLDDAAVAAAPRKARRAAAK